MGSFNRPKKSAEERLAENIQLVGPDIAATLPNHGKPWWTLMHLIRLNALLLICCMSAATVGYDGRVTTVMKDS